MQIDLPNTISAYVQATNGQDADAFASLFANDAIVHDEGQEHRGVTAIRKWFASTIDRYQFTMTPTGLSRNETETILTATLTGEFPGVLYPCIFTSSFNRAKSQSWTSGDRRNPR